MGKYLTRVLLVSAMSCGLTAGSVAHAQNPECRHGIESQRAVKQTIWCVANKLGIPGGPPKAVRIARRESGLGLDESNSYGGACGIFQHYPPSTFSSRYQTYMQRRWLRAPNNCFNDRTNIIVSLTMVNRGGWGPWS